MRYLAYTDYSSKFRNMTMAPGSARHTEGRIQAEQSEYTYAFYSLSSMSTELSWIRQYAQPGQYRHPDYTDYAQR